MKNITITYIFLFISFYGFSQTWVYKKGNNEFDGVFKSAHVQGKANEFPYREPILAINTFDNEEESINFYISDAGFFQSGTDIEIKWAFDKEPGKLYTTYSFSLSSDGKTIFLNSFLDPISEDLLNQYEFINKLKNSSKVSVRISDKYGKNDMTFSLSGSSKAINNVIPNEVIDNILLEIKKSKELEIKNEEIRLKNEELMQKKYSEFLILVNAKTDSFIHLAKSRGLNYSSLFNLEMIIKADLSDSSNFQEYLTLEINPSKLFQSNRNVDIDYVFNDSSRRKIDGNFQVDLNSPLVIRMEQEKAENERMYKEETERIKRLLTKYLNEPLIDHMMTRIAHLQTVGNPTKFQLNEISDITAIFSNNVSGVIFEMKLIIHLNGTDNCEVTDSISKFGITKGMLKQMGGRLDVEF